MMRLTITHREGASASPPAFNPRRWVEEWKQAGGNFTLASDRLAIGQVLGVGANRQRLRELTQQLASNPGAVLSVTAEVRPLMPMEDIDG